MLLLTTTVLSLVACSPSGPDGSTDELRVAMRSDIRGTNPGVERDSVTDDLMLHVVEPLVTYGADLSPVPLLAEAIEVSDDGRKYSFTLREGVTFHNGAPLTAAEVKWTWDRILDPATNWLCLNWYDGSRGLKIAEVEESEERVVTFHLDTTSSLFLDRMANVQCSSGILHPDSVGDDGDWLSPIGTGPYRLSEWRQGEFVLLERFEPYTSPPGPANGLGGNRTPQTKALRWMIIPESAASKAALQSGQVHVVTGLLSSDLADIESRDDLQVYRSESLDWNVLLMQTDDPLMSDVHFRRAIATALDVAAMAEVVTQEISQPNPSTVASASRYHVGCHEQGYRHDVSDARALLEEAGYAGETVVIQTNRRFQNMYDVALLTQNMLQQIGIDARLEVLEWTTQLDNYFNGNFQMMAFGYSGRTDPALSYEAVLGDKTINPLFQWENEDAMNLLEQATRIVDPAEREQLFCQIHAMMIEDVPFVNLFNHYGIDAARTTVSGYAGWPAQKPRFWSVSLNSDDE